MDSHISGKMKTSVLMEKILKRNLIVIETKKQQKEVK